MGHFLKIWGDPYGEIYGEVKGGHIPLCFHQIIVTSNYTPDEIFNGDE